MMNKISKKILILLPLFIFFVGCETMDLDGLKNQNEVGADLNDPVYGFNFVQVNLASFVNSVNGITQQLTRQYAMTGGRTYDNAFQPVDSNTNWRAAYTLLKTIKGYEDIALKNRQYDLLGASKIIRAYIMFTLVDLYGDVPYSEALLGNENLNPKFDKGVDVYKQALTELDEAIVLLDRPGKNDLESTKALDLYYGTGTNKTNFGVNNWKTLARTLKFRAFVTARKAGAELGVNINAEIANLLTLDLIDTPAEDFAFKYSTDDTTSPRTSRHPSYNVAYTSGRSAPYISNYMMWTMTREKPRGLTGSNSLLNLKDPRTLYYFCTQVSDVNGATTFELPSKFSARPDHFSGNKYASLYQTSRLAPFVYVKTVSPAASPYWGNDHGNNAGRPQDADKITLVGVYPAGGKIGGSSSTAQTVSATAGQQGAGIMPIVLSSYISFMKAEVNLTVFGNSAAAKTDMLAGINNSITKVTTLFSGLPTPAASEVTAYTTFVGNFYTSSTPDQLEIIMKEFFIASWGNGLETYNNYRRTGFPSNFQPTIELDSGDFYNSLYYPSDSQATNSNKPSNLRTRKVFWDVNSPILH